MRMMAATEKKLPTYFFFLVFLSLLLLFLDKFSLLTSFKGILANFTNPSKAAIYSLYHRVFFSKKECQENFVWEEKAEQLTTELLVLKAGFGELQAENESMRRLLGAPLSPSFQFLPAKIISGEKEGGVVINKGTKDGLSMGQVVVFEKTYVGEIVKAEEKNAWVRTVFHKEINLPVRVVGSATYGFLKLLNGQVIVDGVARDRKLAAHDILVTAGLNKIPSGIVVGKVKRLIDEPTASFQKAQVEVAVNLKELVDVFVIVEY